MQRTQKKNGANSFPVAFPNSTSAAHAAACSMCSRTTVQLLPAPFCIFSPRDNNLRACSDGRPFARHPSAPATTTQGCGPRYAHQTSMASIDMRDRVQIQITAPSLTTMRVDKTMRRVDAEYIAPDVERDLSGYHAHWPATRPPYGCAWWRPRGPFRAFCGSLRARRPSPLHPGVRA